MQTHTSNKTSSKSVESGLFSHCYSIFGEILLTTLAAERRDALKYFCVHCVCTHLLFTWIVESFCSDKVPVVCGIEIDSIWVWAGGEKGEESSWWQVGGIYALMHRSMAIKHGSNEVCIICICNRECCFLNILFSTEIKLGRETKHRHTVAVFGKKEK